jgi:hypothetical protein
MVKFAIQALLVLAVINGQSLVIPDDKIMVIGVFGGHG